MIYSRRALLALFAVLALSTSVAVFAAPPDAPEPPLSPARARRAEREAEKEAAAAAVAAPAPAPAKSKKAKAANSTALPATGKANTHYYVNARSALYTPPPKDSDKPGTLKLEGVVPTVLGVVKSSDLLESNIGRVTAAQLFGGPKAKQRLPVFDRKEGGLDAVLLGDRGKNATSLFLVLSNPRGFKEGKDSSVEFDAAALSEAQEEADNSDVKFVKGLTRPSRVADTGSGQKIRLEQVVAMIAAYSPHGDVSLKRAKDIVAGTYEKPKAAAKKEKAAKKAADAAEAPAPSPAAGPLAEKVEKVKNGTADAKDVVVEKVGAAKEKVAEPVGRKLLSFADLNPASAGRRLLQQNCGICEYADRSGACKVAPASLDCDGVVGMSGEWNCGTCETYTNNDFLGYCETIPGC